MNIEYEIMDPDDEQDETMEDLWDEYGPEDDDDDNWSIADRYDD